MLWKAQRPGGRIVISTPVEKDGLVYVAAGYGAGCHAFQVKAPAKPDGEFSVSPAYANRNMKNHHGGVILLGNHIYGSNDPGILTAMDYRTGEVAWSDRSIGKGSIAVADGLIYLRSEKTGAMALVEASPAGYKLVSVFTPPDASGKSAWPHPVIAKGVCIYATRMSC